MIEITKENDEIKIVISYKKLIKVYQVCFLSFLILIFILFDFEFPAMILNPVSAILFIYLILISFFWNFLWKDNNKRKLYITRSDKK